MFNPNTILLPLDMVMRSLKEITTNKVYKNSTQGPETGDEKLSKE